MYRSIQKPWKVQAARKLRCLSLLKMTAQSTHPQLMSKHSTTTQWSVCLKVKPSKGQRPLTTSGIMKQPVSTLRLEVISQCLTWLLNCRKSARNTYGLSMVNSVAISIILMRHSRRVIISCVWSLMIPCRRFVGSMTSKHSWTLLVRCLKLKQLLVRNLVRNQPSVLMESLQRIATKCKHVQTTELICLR